MQQRESEWISEKWREDFHIMKRKKSKFKLIKIKCSSKLHFCMKMTRKESTKEFFYSLARVNKWRQKKEKEKVFPHSFSHGNNKWWWIKEMRRDEKHFESFYDGSRTKLNEQRIFYWKNDCIMRNFKRGWLLSSKFN